MFSGGDSKKLRQRRGGGGGGGGTTAFAFDDTGPILPLHSSGGGASDPTSTSAIGVGGGGESFAGICIIPHISQFLSYPCAVPHELVAFYSM